MHFTLTEQRDQALGAVAAYVAQRVLKSHRRADCRALSAEPACGGRCYYASGKLRPRCS